MSSWVILAVFAQLVSAVVALVDKYILISDKAQLRPFVYAFITCLLSGATIVVYAFSGIPVPLDGVHFPDIRNVQFPTLTVVAFSVLAAYTFFGALVSLFSALKQSDASDVIPVVGAVSALSTFALGYLFLNTRLSPNFLIGIMLLSLGTFMVSHLRFSWRVALLSIHAGLFFGLHYIAFKGLLAVTTFDNGFFWSRIGFVFIALSLLLVPEYLEKIRGQVASAGSRGSLFVIGNKILAGLGSILILKATELGDAGVVQALGGLQFVFILIIGIGVGPLIPKKYGENARSFKDIMHKVAFVSIISLGFFVLFK